MGATSSLEWGTQDLEKFKSNDTVKDFGPNWKVEIKNLITNDNTVSDKYQLNKNFENLCVFDSALNVWQECSLLIKNPKQKSKEEIAANIENYEKYLEPPNISSRKRTQTKTRRAPTHQVERSPRFKFIA